ncbi:MAG: DUF1127 domain-containing protein [Rhodobacter sp.]|nr:DUF1127 domain-containing protein [Rhodobacter sp.]
MAFATDIQSFEAGLVRRMRSAFDDARTAAGKRRIYRTTLSELNALTQRELDDLGISRVSIPDIAREAAYGK